MQRLFGAGEVGAGEFGASVAITPDAGTALIGGPKDNAGVGAAWAFTSSGTAWSQQGPKLTASDESGAGSFGNSVALSADGGAGLIGWPGRQLQPRRGLGVRSLGHDLGPARSEAHAHRRNRQGNVWIRRIAVR